MSKDNNGLLVGLMCVMLVFGLILMAGVYGRDSGLSKEDITSLVSAEVTKIKVPSAAEVASLIVIPEMKKIDVPECKGEAMVKDLWEEMYDLQIGYIESEAEKEVDSYMDEMNKFESDEYDELVDWFKGLVEGSYFDDDYDKYEKSFEYEYESRDCDIEVMELGLEDDEDSVAKVVCEFEVEHNLVGEANNHEFDKDVVFTFDVVLEETEFDEGAFSSKDQEVKASYALAE